MTWVPISLSPSDAVMVTVTKSRAVISLGITAQRSLGLSEDEPNVSLSLGTGEDAGWLRITLDEEGMTGEPDSGRITLSVPRSTLPDLTPGRVSPVAWRTGDRAIDVRLPTVAATKHQPGRPRVVAGTEAEESYDRPTAIAVPDLYKGLHREAWSLGLEITFLSDGNVAVMSGGRAEVITVDEMEGAVRRAKDRAASDRQRASA